MGSFQFEVFSFQEVLTTIEHLGGFEKEQPKVGPKGEEVGTSESKDTESTEVGRYRRKKILKFC
jgi:hypothetical protein